MTRNRFILSVLLASLAACADPGPQLVYAPVAPSEDEFPLPGVPPNGSPEPVRYMTAYQSFWWNCVMVMAKDLNARCPFNCSGTTAASYGCSDGEMDATSQITDLLKRYPRPEIRQYLQSYARENGATGKLEPYFNNGPKPFIVDLPVE